jgi:hypothetical protein
MTQKLTNMEIENLTKINHYKCDICKSEITFLENLIGDCDHEKFYIIKRSNYEVFINEDNDIELNDENIKMQRYICESCFLQIIKESKILRKLIYD